MQRWRCRDEVWRVAVGEEGPGAEGKGPSVAVQGGRLSRLWVRFKHGGLLALLVLAGHFSVACLNAILLHGEGPVDLRDERNQLLRNLFSQTDYRCKGCAEVKYISEFFSAWLTHIVQFKVESTGVAHRLSVGVASPQCCCAGVAVGTQCSCPLTDNLTQRRNI